MLGLGSLVLALAGVFLVSGLLELPVWPGVSAGLAAVVLAVAELRRERTPSGSAPFRKYAWVGLGLGGLAALAGILIYIGAWIWSLT